MFGSSGRDRRGYVSSFKEQDDGKEKREDNSEADRGGIEADEQEASGSTGDRRAERQRLSILVDAGQQRGVLVAIGGVQQYGGMPSNGRPACGSVGGAGS